MLHKNYREQLKLLPQEVSFTSGVLKIGSNKGILRITLHMVKRVSSSFALIINKTSLLGLMTIEQEKIFLCSGRSGCNKGELHKKRLEKKVSFLESKELIDDDLLNEISRASKVPVDAI